MNTGNRKMALWAALLLGMAFLLLAGCGSMDLTNEQNHSMTDTMQQGVAPAEAASSVQPGQAATSYSEEELSGYADEMRELLARGKLRVAMYREDRYPFFYVDSQGELKGTDVDLASGLAAGLGIQVEFIRTAASFDEVIGQVFRGEADIGVSKLSMTMERAKRVLFSHAYLNLKQALLIHRMQLAALGKSEAGDDPLSVLQQRAQRIGIVKGTSYAGFAKDLFPQQQQLSYASSAELFQAVQSEEVEAAVYDAFEISRYLYNHPSSSIQLQFVELEDQDDEIAVAVAPAQYHLLQWINVYLEWEGDDLRKQLTAALNQR